jgi:SulP family sulfate permease
VAPRRADVRADLVAGVPGAIGSVPDGMAASVLAGVNPVHGLYAGLAGPIAGGLGSSSQLMVITTTSAAALAAGSTLRDVPAADRPGALFLLTALAGAAMIVAGIMRLGRYTRFVPHSVMIGLLSGVAVNIIAGQLVDLTGATATASNPVARAFEVLVNPRTISGTSLAVGLAALGLILVLRRTTLGPFGALISLVVPSAVVLLADLSGVARVDDAGAIPQGLPMPALPELRHLTPGLALGALAIAVLVLVQGAGVAEAAPNPDDSPADADRNFIAQGAGNVASGLLRGQPVGGSVGQTALNVSAGARSRWGTIFSGLWMAAILVALSGLVGRVAVPTLAAVLIAAAAGSLRPGQIQAIFRTSPTSQVALVTTFGATLLVPVTQAVAIGVATSLLLQLNQEALDLRVVALEPLGDGRFAEHPAPERLPDETVTVLHVYGSLLYAGSRTLAARLPEAKGTHRPVVVLRLRGRVSLGATFFQVVAGYASDIEASGGRFYVSGVDPALIQQMERNGMVPLKASLGVFQAESVLGASTSAAIADAGEWLMERKERSE